jgi:hypothetical protein
LAYWISTDGTFNKPPPGTVVLCTDSFSADEIDFLRSILLEKFNIKSSTVSNGSGKNQFRIYIAKGSLSTLQNLVDPHMPPSMRYRAGL